MENNLTDYQKEVFYDIYKTALGSLLSTLSYGSGPTEYNQMIEDAVYVAETTVAVLFDKEKINIPDDVGALLYERKH